VEFDLVTSPENGKLSAANVTGPNGAPVLGTQPQRRDDGPYRRPSDRGDSPRRYNSSDGPRSYPRRSYSDRQQSQEGKGDLA
jgi:hypothetical protein